MKATMYTDYKLKKLSEITDCDHKNAQFYGAYSLVGYYYCTSCKSKFCPQEFQVEHLGWYKYAESNE